MVKLNATIKDLQTAAGQHLLLFANIPSGCALHEVICDAFDHPIAYRFIDVNPAFEKMTGLGRDHVLGKSIREVLPNIEAYWIENFCEVAMSGKPISFAEYSKDLDKYFEVFAYCPKKGQFVAIFHDITDHQRALEQLRKEKEFAEVANQAKSDFLSYMSHDLRTPLNAIIGFSEMMDLETFGPLNEPHYKAYVTDIYKSGEHLLSLINDILDLSKIEAGKYYLQEEVLDLGDLIQNCVRMVTVLAKAKQLTLILDIKPQLTQICGDKRALAQILNNLLSNAIKFTPENGTIKITERKTPENTVVLSVADNGIGMSHQDVDLSTHRYERSANQHREPNEGTGLGLFLSKNLAELHGCSFDIQSEINEGTTITIEFPHERLVKDVN